MRAFAAGLATLLSFTATSTAQEAQAPLLVFYDIPIHWIEPAHRALRDFSRRHRDNLDCFVTSLTQQEDGAFTVSFSPRATVTETEDAITITRPTTCGLGESFHFDAEGRLTRHNYMRH